MCQKQVSQHFAQLREVVTITPPDHGPSVGTQRPSRAKQVTKKVRSGVFFGIVAVIQEQHLFRPVTDSVLALEGVAQTAMLYVANGVLSMISDNVFVATVYIGQVKEAMLAGALSEEQFQLLAVAINTGTNIPSVATPNGQAAFLFLLTSALAPLIRLSYGRMVWMAFPYTITMSITGLLAIIYLL